MKIEADLPTAVEGSWKLVGEDGKSIATSEDAGAAKLVIEPYFYEGVNQQNVTRLTTKGDSGGVVRQMLRVAANSGRTTAHDMDKERKRVKPAFDEQQPKPEPRKK